MGFPERLLRQTAVYWGNPVADGYGGRSFDPPLELPVRWEERAELFVDAQGQEVVSRARVFVDRELDYGGYLFLGTLDDLSSPSAEPFELARAYEIRGYSSIPSIDTRRVTRYVWL